MNLLKVSASLFVLAIVAVCCAAPAPAKGEGRVAKEEAQSAVLCLGDVSMNIDGEVLDFGDGFFLVVGESSIVRASTHNDETLVFEDLVSGEVMTVLLHDMSAGDAITLLGKKPNAPDDTPHGKCREQAEQACGEGKICWVLVVAPSPEVGEVCAYMCRDGQGNCPPMPSPFKRDMLDGIDMMMLDSD